MGILSRLLGGIGAIGVGEAAGAAIEPKLQPQRQKAFTQTPVTALGLGTIADTIAQGLTDLATGAGEALLSGYNETRLSAVVQTMLTAPGAPEALTLLRRGYITAEQFTHALSKARLEEQWWQPLQQLSAQILTPAEIALAVVRGNMVNASNGTETLLPVGPPTEVGNVPADPVSPIDPVAEAAAGGWSFDRLAVFARSIGLPPGPVQMMQMLNRGIIEDVDFLRGIAEGDVRNEWGSFLMQLKRMILTPHNYAELQLRGYLTSDQRDAGAALSGMEPADAELLYDVLGRSIPVKQILTGQRRGGTYDGDYSQIPEAFLASLQRSNLRPEYYSLAYANRETIPGYFVIEALLKAGTITADEGEQWFLELGWPEQLAQQAAAEYAAGSTTTQKKLTAAALSEEYSAGHLEPADYTAALEALGYSSTAAQMEQDLADYRTAAKYRAAAVSALNKQYVDHDLTDAQATAALTELGLTQGAITQTLFYWGFEQAQSRKTLTAAQIKRAYTKSVITEAAASSALEALGYTAGDALTYLEE